MNIAAEVTKALPADVIACRAEDTYLYGTKAVRVTATLATRQIVEGIFTTEDKDAFGGVEFNNRKDVVALMVSKIRSVLEGTHER